MLTRAVCSTYAHHLIEVHFSLNGAGQVGGYVEVYDGLTFSTVRNAGHMVPTLKLKGRIICSLTGFMERTYKQIMWADLPNLLTILSWVKLVIVAAS